MKKPLGKLMVGLVVLAALGLAGAWYQLSGALVDGAKQLVSAVAQAPQADDTKITIAYDAITRTGFPVVGVRLTNPTVTVNVPANDVAQPPTPALHVLWKRTGTVDFIKDFVSQEYRLVSDGSGTTELNTGDTSLALNSSLAHVVLAVKAKDLGVFQQWAVLDWSKAENLKTVIAELEGLRINAGVINITDAATGATLLSQEKGEAHFVNRTSDTTIDFDLSILSKGVVVTQAYNAFVERIGAIFQLPRSVQLEAMPFSAARAGKQDVDVAMHVSLPKSMGAQGLNAKVQVSRFNFKNDFYTLTAPTDIALSEAAGQRNAHVALEWQLTVSPAAAEEGKRLAQTLAGIAPPAADAAVDPELFQQKISDALPNFSAAGPIRFAVNLDATAPSPAPAGAAGNAAAKDSLTLREFALTHKRWGLVAKGESLNNENGASINITLTCNLCDTLTGDLFGTASSIQEVLNLSTPGRASLPLTPALLTTLNDTLAQIGSKDSSGNISFAFTTPKPGEVAINGKPLAEVLPKLMAVFAAAQPQAQPQPEDAPTQ